MALFRGGGWYTYLHFTPKECVVSLVSMKRVGVGWDGMGVTNRNFTTADTPPPPPLPLPPQPQPQHQYQPDAAPLVSQLLDVLRPS